MITLELEPYCQDCRGFEAETSDETNTLYSRGELVESVVDIRVRCKYRKRCANMMRYLSRQTDKPKD